MKMVLGQRKVALSIIVIVLIVIASILASITLFKSSEIPLRILVVTGEGLQETYGFYNTSHFGNGYNYHRDMFWTESTYAWTTSTRYALVSVDSSERIYGNYSVLFDFNAQYSSYYFYHRVSHPYGYLAKGGDKWLYFEIMFNKTDEIDSLEIRAIDYEAINYFSTTILNISDYPPHEWIRFKVRMNDMMPEGSPNWGSIYGLQFLVDLTTRFPLKVWIDDIMMTSTYHYILALENLKVLFKGIVLDVRDYNNLPSRIDEYTAIIYLDNRINSTGISLIDKYVNRGGGLILMGLSTLWLDDGRERVNFPLGCSPVNVMNTTETFLDDAQWTDYIANHSALLPWTNYTLFTQRGLESYRPVPYLGIAETYNVSLRAGAETLITEGNFIYEVAYQYGRGRVVYFAENLVKRIANGMLEAYNLRHGKFGTKGWGGATADRLQLLESATNFVSKYPLPKILTVPFANKGAFVLTIPTIASTKWYWYLNNSCTNILGDRSNDTAFWHIVERMKNQSEETNTVFTMLISTEQIANELRQGYEEAKFHPENLRALIEAYASPHVEIGVYTSNLMTWANDSGSFEKSYMNMWQGVLDLRSALNISEYQPLVFRYPGSVRSGESMYGVSRAELLLDVTDGWGSVVVPYSMEAPIWNLQSKGAFVSIIEGNEQNLRKEETMFDWYVENDLIYQVMTHDLEIAANPSHEHQASPNEPIYQTRWNQTQTFLKYVGERNETTWIVGGVTLAKYLINWQGADVETTYNRNGAYTFKILNAPNGYTVRIPLKGTHVRDVVSSSERILKEQGAFAYLALLNPEPSETVEVTLGKGEQHNDLNVLAKTLGSLPVNDYLISKDASIDMCKSLKMSIGKL